MVGLNVRKWGFYDKTVKNFKPFCWWDAFRSVWMRTYYDHGRNPTTPLFKRQAGALSLRIQTARRPKTRDLY
jgi:hypothetical protein